jgi:acetylglutamate kinase
LIDKLDREHCEQLIADGTICGSMVPKVLQGFAALEKGVAEVHICHSDKLASNGLVSEGTELSLAAIDD